MEAKELTNKSLTYLKNKFIKSYLEIWNSKSNIQYLSYTGLEFTRKQLEDWVLNLKDSDNIKYYYVEDSDIITGILVLSENVLTGVEILGIGIRENYKRKGFGSILLNKSIDVAKNKKYKSIETSVFVDNKAMLCLLLNNNFTIFNVEHGKRYDGLDIVRLKNLFK